METIKKLQQGGWNPIGQYGNASELYQSLTQNLLPNNIFDKFLNQPSSGNPELDAKAKTNMQNQIKAASAVSGLFKLADMSKISSMQNPILQSKQRRTASWMGQEGGPQDQPEQEQEPNTDINEIFSILKQYAEDRNFTNEDGSITKENLKELILLLETDQEADFEREKLMQILPVFAEEKNPPEALRNYWNRGVIPTNRREDVLKYGNPDVEFLQEGRNFKAPQSEEYRQRMGYKDNSPFKNMPKQTFDTDSITMEGVSQPLLAVADNGLSTVMQPGMNYHFPGAISVTEYPMQASNGLNIGTIIKAQDSAIVDGLDDYLYQPGMTLPEVEITAKRIQPQRTTNNPELAMLEFSPMANVLRFEAAGLDAKKNKIVTAYEEIKRRQDTDRMVAAMLNAVQMPNTEATVFAQEDVLQGDQQPMLMANGGVAKGGIPERYRRMGFSRVGQKKQSNRPGKKWQVLAKKGDQYKVVHGGAAGMSDFTKHKNEKGK